jgi:lipopolysaccharide assembly protein A
MRAWQTDSHPMNLIVWAFRILMLLMFFGFALLNTGRVTIDALFVQWNTPLALALMVFFAAGALMGIALFIPAVMRHKKALRRLQARPPVQTARTNAEPPPGIG